MNPPTLRAATLDDVPALLHLEQTFPGDRMSARAVRGFITSPRARVQVACRDARVVGSSVLLRRRNSRWARLYSLVVDVDARGQGIAQRLMADAERAAQEAGCVGVSLEVRVDNHAAQRLYAASGYHVHERLPAYYDDGAPGVRLRKALVAGLV